MNSPEREDLLRDEAISPIDAWRWARDGDDEDRRVLAFNPSLPVDLALYLARSTDPEVHIALLINRNTSTEVLSLVASAGLVDPVEVGSHWNAPLELKLLARLDRTPSRSLEQFVVAVRATDEELKLLDRALVSARNRRRTLGEVWRKIRPVAVT